MELVSYNVFTIHSLMIQYSSGLGRCALNQFECPHNLTCINDSRQCDGINDCSDGFDEFFCSLSTNCDISEYRCLFIANILHVCFVKKKSLRLLCMEFSPNLFCLVTSMRARGIQ